MKIEIYEERYEWCENQTYPKKFRYLCYYGFLKYISNSKKKKYIYIYRERERERFKLHMV